MAKPRPPSDRELRRIRALDRIKRAVKLNRTIVDSLREQREVLAELQKLLDKPARDGAGPEAENESPGKARISIAEAG